MPRKRILFIGEAVTLAHIARPFVLANSLDQNNYDVHFACDERFNNLFDFEGLNIHPIYSISSERFLRALSKGSPVYDFFSLKNYVEEDLKILEEVNPDVVVGDFRLSLAISAKLRQTAYVTITNAYWGPYTIQKYPVPEIPITSVFGPKIAQFLFNLARPVAFGLHTLPFNKACKHFGVPPLSNDLREIYTQADLTLYADPLELFHTGTLPINHKFVGPILWSPNTKLPAWWQDVPNDIPAVFLTLGSSGNRNVLPQILNTLGRLPVTVLLSTAGHDFETSLPENTFKAKFLPGQVVCNRADLVICNGGSPSTYQSLAEGTPVIGIPSNLDQFLNMQALQNYGVGTTIRSSELKGSNLSKAINQLLTSNRLNESGQNVASMIAKYDSTAAFEEIIAHQT